MKLKRAILILLSAGIGLFAIQNQTNVRLQFLWYSFPISLIILVLAIFLFGLIVGLLISPKSKTHSANETTENSEEAKMDGAQNLSQEDQDFLSED